MLLQFQARIIACLCGHMRGYGPILQEPNSQGLDQEDPDEGNCVGYTKGPMNKILYMNMRFYEFDAQPNCSLGYILKTLAYQKL